MRDHLSLQQIADALGVQETYAGQAFDPALEKITKLYLRFPSQTLRLILDKADELRLTPMPESELAERIRRQTGKADRQSRVPVTLAKRQSLSRPSPPIPPGALPIGSELG